MRNGSRKEGEGRLYIRQTPDGKEQIVSYGMLDYDDMWSEVYRLMVEDIGIPHRTAQREITMLQRHGQEALRILREGGIVQAHGKRVGFGDELPVATLGYVQEGIVPARVRADDMPSDIRELTRSDVGYQKLYVLPRGTAGRLHPFPIGRYGMAVEVQGHNGDRMKWFGNRDQLGCDGLSRVLGRHGEWLFDQTGLDYSMSPHSLMYQVMLNARNVA